MKAKNLMADKYHLTQTITEQAFQQYITKHDEAEAVFPWLKDIVPGAAGKLNTIGVERSGAIAAFLMELAAHPEFMPTDVGTTHAPLKAVLVDFLRRLIEHRETATKRLIEAYRLASDDLNSDGSAYYTNTQLCQKRKVPDAGTTITNLKPYFGKSGRKKAKKTPPAKT